MYPLVSMLYLYERLYINAQLGVLFFFYETHHKHNIDSVYYQTSNSKILNSDGKIPLEKNIIEKNKLRHVNIIAHVSLGASFAKLTIFTTTPLEEEKDKGEGEERRTKREKEKAKQGERGRRKKAGGKIKK